MKELCELFKILGNEKRLEILFVLRKEKKLSEIAHELNIPSPEVARNLKILHNAGLVMKDEDRYEISNLGILLLENSLSFSSFVWEHRDIFSNHILPLPKEFLCRTGEFKDIKIIYGIIDGFNLSLKRFEKTRYYQYAAAEKILEGFVNPVVELLKRGVEVRLLLSQSSVDYLKGVESKHLKLNSPNLKIKLKDKIPITILVDENSAEINLPFLDGRMDYGITLYSENQSFRRWVLDVFYYLWKEGTEIKI